MERLELVLPASVTAPRAAREFLRASLATRDLDGFGDVSELLTTELVTNAVVHADSSLTLRVITWGDRVRVEVDDASTRPAVPRPRDPTTPSGNGLLLVEELATRWGVDLREDGKTVWFEIDIPTATRKIHGT